MRDICSVIENRRQFVCLVAFQSTKDTTNTNTNTTAAPPAVGGLMIDALFSGSALCCVV